MASDVLAFSPTQVEKYFKNQDTCASSDLLNTEEENFFQDDSRNDSQLDQENAPPSNVGTADFGECEESVPKDFLKEIGDENSDDDDDVQPVKSKSKQRALTEKQRESEKLKLHSESQRIMRTGALKLPKLISAKSKASLEEFVKPETRFGNFLRSKQISTPNTTERKNSRLECENQEAASQPVEKTEKTVEKSIKETRSRLAALRAKKLEKLLGKPLPELKTASVRELVIEKELTVESSALKVKSVEHEIVLVKSAKDIQKDRLIERFTLHSQKKKVKEPMPKSSPLVTAASAVDERVLVQMMSQSVEEAKKDSAAAAGNQSAQKGNNPNQLGSQVLPPGRGRFLLKGKLRDCMLDKMRERHEVRCELYQQELKDYNERMGIEEEEGENKANELESEDEDFEPDQGQASDDDDEGDSGSDIGSDVAGEGGENEEDEDEDEEERRERNLLIEDEAEEDDDDEQDAEDDNLAEKDANDVTECRGSAKGNHLSKGNEKRSTSSRHASNKGAGDNSLERNETMLSDVSSYFPAAQIRRSESNVTSLEGLNNNQSFDDSFLPVGLFRTDSTKSSNADESIFSQSNVFDDDGFLRTERSNHKEKSQKEHDNWIKSLLNNSSTESANNQSNNGIVGTYDDEVANLCSQNEFPAPAKFCPQKEDAVIDPEDLGFPCSGTFQSQCINSEKASQSMVYMGQAVHTKKLVADPSVEASTSHQQMLNSVAVTRASNPTPSGDSMESMEMLCSAPFVSSQAPVRSQSSPLEEEESVGGEVVDGAPKKVTTGRLESPAFFVDDVNASGGKTAKEKQAFTSLETKANIGSDSVNQRKEADEDEDDDVITRSAKKPWKEGVDRSKSRRRRKIQLIADSDSEDDGTETGGVGSKLTAETGDMLTAEVDKTVTQLAAGLVSVGQNKTDNAGNMDDTAYSVKLFSESTGSVMNLTTGQQDTSAASDRVFQQKGAVEDDMMSVMSEAPDKQQQSAPRLRRVVLDEEDSSDEDADDEGAESGEDDDQGEEGEGEGEDGDEGGYEDSEAEEEGEGRERVNEELLEFRRGMEMQAKMKEFFEDEAELSGSDAGQGGSDDEGDFGDLNPNEYEKEGIDDELKVSNKQLMDENGRLLLDEMLSEDQRNLKLLQEFLIGDDEDDGMQRVRRFIWRGLDENDGSLLFHNADDSDEDDQQFLDPTAKTAFMTNMAAAIGAVQDLSEQTGSTARARLELSQWLQSQQASIQLQNAHEKHLESSQSQAAVKAIQKLKMKTASFFSASQQSDPTNPQGALGANGNMGVVDPHTVSGGTGGSAGAVMTTTRTSAAAPAEWSTMPISHYFKRSSSSLSSDTLFRHSSLLKRAAERLSIVADKLREKSSSNASSSVLKPVVDTKNMVFKPKSETHNSANIKRKSNLDEITASGGGVPKKKKQKLDISSRISSSKSFILDNLD